MKKKIFSVIFLTICIFFGLNKTNLTHGAVLIDTTSGIATSTLQNACTATDYGGYTAEASLLSVDMGQMPISENSGSLTIIFYSNLWEDYNLTQYVNFTIGSSSYQGFISPTNLTISPDISINSVFTMETVVLTNVTANAGDEIILNASLGNQGRFNCVSVLSTATSTYKNSLDGGDNTRHWNDPYFVILDNQALSFYYPTNNSTIADFLNWQISGSGLSNTSTYRININYNIPNNPVMSDYNLITPASSYGIYPVIKNNALWFAPMATTTQYNATAYLYLCDPNNLTYCGSPDFTGTAIASTSINFFINMEATTSTPTNNFCNFTTQSFWVDPMGNTENALCNAFFSMFLLTSDNNSALNSKFNDIYSSVKNKPPFGYFTSITNSLNSLNVNSSTPQLIDSSTTSFFGKIFSPLRSGIAILFSLLFVFWLLWKVTNIKL